MINKIILTFICLIFLVAWFGFPSIIKCPYKELTGEPCLFCGTLTGLSFLLHGRITKAWDTNPIGVFIFLGLVFFFIYEWLKLSRSKI